MTTTHKPVITISGKNMGSSEELYNDDNFEFQDEINSAAVSVPNEENEPGELLEKENPSLKKKLVKLAKESRTSPTQVFLFLSAVELDLLRPEEEKLGLLRLFREYCKNGNKTWLNPAVYLRKIDEILFKFACTKEQRAVVLRPFIELLADLAAEQINPAAVLMYIMEPRLAADYSWRKWTGTHLSALRIIGDILVAMREQPPFDKEVLGNEANRLSRDVVLVKYVGRPLALFPENQLRDRNLRHRYMEGWFNLALDNSFTIIFMKTNLLHFMYALSGKIDFLQLIQIIENMPEIEAGFRENFPDDYFQINLRTININLYNYDIATSINSRKNKGFKSYDFVAEIKAYLKIIAALLNTNSGLYLCGFFAARIAVAKDPVIAETLASLVDVLNDRGGMHIYTWHAKRLLAGEKADHPAYLELVEENNGCDPHYPRIEDIFSDIFIEGQGDAIKEIADELNIPLESILRESAARRGENTDAEEINRLITGISGINMVQDISYKDLLNAYIKQYPWSGEIIDRYREQFFRGEDRSWDKDLMKSFDSLGVPLHSSLLRSVIRGIGAGFSSAPKTATFAALYAEFGEVNQKEHISTSVEFSLPVKETGDVGRLKQQEIRKKINLELIADLWKGLKRSPGDTVNEILPFVNRFSTRLIGPIEKSGTERLQAEERLQNAETDAEKKKLQLTISGLEKTLRKLESQRNEFEEIMELYRFTDDTRRMIVGLFMASTRSKTGSPFSTLMLSLLLERYNEDESLSRRLEFLHSDVAIEMITFRQFNYIVNTVDRLIQLVMDDPDFIFFVNSQNENDLALKEKLGSFIITRNRECTLEAVNAAVKRLISYNKISRERARWQSIIESIESKDSAYFRNYRLYTSKAVMDAYYGDMGAICLSGYPYAIKEDRFYAIRLISEIDREIVGMALLYGSYRGLGSYRQNIPGFWHSFAFNPLRSLLTHMSQKQQIFLYLQYRKILEQVARATGWIVVISGIGTWGIVSNDDSFKELVVGYEVQHKPMRVADAYGLQLYYTQQQYADALVIIDPQKEETFRAEKDLRRITL
ncbi:MAG: hypothetical protein GY754_23825 [bacterium]|nr:hypothetical protein [bacterium]